MREYAKLIPESHASASWDLCNELNTMYHKYTNRICVFQDHFLISPLCENFPQHFTYWKRFTKHKGCVSPACRSLLPRFPTDLNGRKKTSSLAPMKKEFRSGGGGGAGRVAEPPRTGPLRWDPTRAAARRLGRNMRRLG